MPKFDEYTRTARYRPALLVVAPAAIAILVLFSGYSLAWGVLAGPVAAFGLTAMIAQIGRDAGKAKEPLLYSAWGGKPSVAHLRHRDPHVNQITKERYHRDAGALIGRLLPTSAEEERDPKIADEIYGAVSDALLRSTRSTKDFPLVFEELKNYGFRRNLWGMKPAGVLISVLSILGIGLSIVRVLPKGVPTLEGLSLLICSLFLAAWISRITPEWVRIAAVAYADRLLESLPRTNPDGAIQGGRTL